MNTLENVAMVLHLGRSSPASLRPEADCTPLNNHSRYHCFQLNVPADQLMTGTVLQLSAVVTYLI